MREIDINGNHRKAIEGYMVNIDLKEILKKRSQDDLLDKIDSIKNEAIPLLDRILITFPEYTAHDASHSEIIITRINDLIPINLKENLNSYEIYFLIISAYLHDLGMAELEDLDAPNDIKDDREKLKEYIRDNHNTRSEKYIINFYNKLKIPDINQARIIGRICRGHRKEWDDDLFDSTQTYKDKIINVPFLASVLRVCDELDLTFERIPLIVYEMGLIDNPESKSEWEKHLSVAGVALDSDGQLICTATCKDPEIHRMLRKIESKINEQLEHLHNHLYGYREYSSCIPWKFKLKINAEGYKYYDFKFSLKENEILKLLIGTGFYERPEECIRELLKNCVDTCRYKSKILKQNEGDDYDYNPKIIFELTSKKDKLIVSDNGFGMDKYIIENYFTKIGKSFYKSPDFQLKGNDFSPVSELGIGFLSCFMIANKIEIETKTDYSEPMLIEIDDISNYFLVRNGKRSQSGTKIVLYLKENASKIEIKEELEYYARHIEIPIDIKLPSGKYIINNLQNKPFFKLENIQDELLFMKFIKLNNDNFEGTIGILLKKNNDKFFPFTSSDLIVYNETDEKDLGNNAIICNNGILVCSMCPVPEWLNSGVVFQDINLKNNILNFNLSRNQIIFDEKYAEFSESLEKIIIQFLVSILDKMESYNQEEINSFIKHITDSNFNEVVLDQSNYYDNTRSQFLIKDDSDLLQFLKKFYSFECFSDKCFNLMKYDEIIKLDKKVKILKHFRYNYNYIEDILFNCSSLDDDNLYIICPNHDLIDGMINHLFSGHELLNFLDLFEVEFIGGLEKIFPDRINIIDIKNFNTTRLVTHANGNFASHLGTFKINININNKFVKLICDNKKIIYDENRNLVKELFRHLLLRSKMDCISEEQKIILKWFAEQDLIEEKDFEDYMITERDLEGISCIVS